MTRAELKRAGLKRTRVEPSRVACLNIYKCVVQRLRANVGATVQYNLICHVDHSHEMSPRWLGSRPVWFVANYTILGPKLAVRIE